MVLGFGTPTISSFHAVQRSNLGGLARLTQLQHLRLLGATPNRSTAAALEALTKLTTLELDFVHDGYDKALQAIDLRSHTCLQRLLLRARSIKGECLPGAKFLRSTLVQLPCSLAVLQADMQPWCEPSQRPSTDQPMPESITALACPCELLRNLLEAQLQLGRLQHLTLWGATAATHGSAYTAAAHVEDWVDLVNILARGDAQHVDANGAAGSMPCPCPALLPGLRSLQANVAYPDHNWARLLQKLSSVPDVQLNVALGVAGAATRTHVSASSLVGMKARSGTDLSDLLSEIGASGCSTSLRHLDLHGLPRLRDPAAQLLAPLAALLPRLASLTLRPVRFELAPLAALALQPELEVLQLEFAVDAGALALEGAADAAEAFAQLEALVCALATVPRPPRPAGFSSIPAASACGSSSAGGRGEAGLPPLRPAVALSRPAWTPPQVAAAAAADGVAWRPVAADRSSGGGGAGAGSLLPPLLLCVPQLQASEVDLLNRQAEAASLGAPACVVSRMGVL